MEKKSIEIICSKIDIDGLVKSKGFAFFVIPVKLVLDLIGERESRKFEYFWTPAPRFRGDKFTPAKAGAGVTASRTFYESIKQ